jgi:hypothetical protein
MNIHIHYIFIDSNNKDGNENENENFKKIKDLHSRHYSKSSYKNVSVNYYSYNDIMKLLLKFDKTLYNIAININIKYPALIADIGRFIILYYYGGVYLDLKFIITEKFINFINNEITDVDFIAEEHPWLNYLRLGCISSFKLNDKFIKNILGKIKESLYYCFMNNLSGSTEMYRIVNLNYNNIFNEYSNSKIIKKNYTNLKFIINNREKVNKKLVRWQDTNYKIINIDFDYKLYLKNNSELKYHLTCNKYWNEGFLKSKDLKFKLCFHYINYGIKEGRNIK